MTQITQSITTISGKIVDVVQARIYSGTITIENENGTIVAITEDSQDYENYILPGLVDSHIHIESSLLTPSQFAKAAAIHGTVAVVTDPHEIANVLGIDGVRFMIADAQKTPLQFYFGVPSSVPASPFETNGAILGPLEVEKLFKDERLHFMGEIMNVPGVINGDPVLLDKIAIAKKYSALLDGHAPGLSGEALHQYIRAGISTDHEAVSLAEALEKINLGMKIQIREGSAAKDFNQLHPLLQLHPEAIMFCSDDKHPDDLVEGHINLLVKRALHLDYNIFNILQAAVVNPKKHYRLGIGLLQPGDRADFIVVDNLIQFNVLKTYIQGRLIAKNGQALFDPIPSNPINHFQVSLDSPEDLRVPYQDGQMNVIEITDGQLITGKIKYTPHNIGEYVQADPQQDILKITVINRYQPAPPSIGFIKNFGIKKGAVASSVAHDSHNIIAIGADDESLWRAIQLIINNQGGISAVSPEVEVILPLPIGGIMSHADYREVASQYQALNKLVKAMGSTLQAPFMTLSFMALLVIPKLKISDRGLFDSEKFEFINLFSE